MGFEKAAGKGEVEPGTSKLVEIGDKKIAIFNVDGEFFAIDNTCAHRGGPLCEGSVDGKTVTCPWHGWKFSIESGVSETMPTSSVSKYNVKVEGDDVLVEV